MTDEWIIVKLHDVSWNEYKALLEMAKARLPADTGITELICQKFVSEIRDIRVTGAWLEQHFLEKKPSVVLFPATEAGKQVAAWLAGRMGLGLTADLMDFYMDGEGRLHQIRMAYGGSLQAEIVSQSGIQMATVKIGRESPSIVVAGGMGAGKEGFALLKELAALLGGQLGATRAAVDAGYAPFASQIGQSGSYVCPAYYLAFGISGAVQHLAGMKDSGTIVAVNTDKRAPIFRYADYAVCGDVCETAEHMIRQLRSRMNIFKMRREP